MNTLKKNDLGVSPVIAVILMVAITVVLAGVVFLWAQSFTDEAGGDVETMNVKGAIDATGVTIGGTPGPGLSIEIISGKVDWTLYEVTFDGTIVYTTAQTAAAAPTVNAGESNAGDTQWFTVAGLTATSGTEYTIKIINIGDNKVVWEDDIIATA